MLAKAPYHALATVYQAAADNDVERDDVPHMLRLFHELGVIVAFDRPGIRDFIVVDPQWLVDAIGAVIREYKEDADGGQFHRNAAGDDALAEEMDGGASLRRLQQCGELRWALLARLWSEETYREDGVQDFLVSLLQRFYLLAPLPADAETGDRLFLVPSLLPPDLPGDVATEAGGGRVHS